MAQVGVPLSVDRFGFPIRPVGIRMLQVKPPGHEEPVRVLDFVAIKIPNGLHAVFQIYAIVQPTRECAFPDFPHPPTWTMTRTKPYLIGRVHYGMDCPYKDSEGEHTAYEEIVMNTDSRPTRIEMEDVDYILLVRMGGKDTIKHTSSRFYSLDTEERKRAPPGTSLRTARFHSPSASWQQISDPIDLIAMSDLFYEYGGPTYYE